jgi:DNA-binding Lrp family transcriptional regulator
MAKRGPKTEQQFRYWHMRRMGRSQADIAREVGITRQAVSKSIQLLERDVVFRLLDTAQMSGVLVEWYDAERGVLVGVTPQLGNLVSVLLIDGSNRTRLFYDQTNNPDEDVKGRTMEELTEVLGTSLGVTLGPGVDFDAIVRALTRKAKRGG